jgi:hypothetical protein
MVVGQEVLLPDPIEECPRFEAQTVDNMAVIDAMQPLPRIVSRGVKPRQFDHLLTTEESHNPVMVQMQRQCATH